ncbi:MAG: TerC family protein [Phycisphaerae bacterium]
MQVLLYAGFVLLILALLAFDLGVFNRKPGAVSVSGALAWAAVWVGLALAFNVAVYFIYRNQLFGIGLAEHHCKDGWTAAKLFFLGYLVEESLSLDNIFVMAVILDYFRVPPAYRHRTLFWGIVGALVMRGAMIAAGAVLIHKFEWVIYLFGALLVFTAIKMLLAHDRQTDPGRNPLARLARRFYPVSADFEGQKFFTWQAGRRAITPLFLALLVIESSDVLFAIDSIPAIFAITRDPFIVYTSNMFAILGLRSLYFALAAMLDRFHYLRYSLVFLLAFVGVKMLLSNLVPIDHNVALVVICTILAIGVVASLVRPRPPVPTQTP